MPSVEKPKLTESLTFKLTDTLKEQLEERARKARRDLSDYMRILSEDHVAEAPAESAKANLNP